MSNRRKRPPNRVGCKPTEDVCVEHDEPLWCRHGCEQAKEHKCKAYEVERHRRAALADELRRKP